MISFDEVIKVIRKYLQATMDDIPAGLSTASGSIPLYKCNKNGLPPVCKSCQEYHECRSICVNFYKSLGIGRQKIVCPFGINISYLKLDNMPKQVGFFLQTCFIPERVNINNIDNLNRIPKKSIKKAVEETSSFKFLYNNETEDYTFDFLKRTLETLFAGRVAASMRALTHEILTPVQGAISDLQEIKRQHEQDKYKKTDKYIVLLEANIDEISSVAKRVHILLAEDIEPSPQRIRRVVVHNFIKKACERLGSIALTKNLNFVEDYNKGSKIVDAIPDQMEIVFKCLLDNAVKYSFSGKMNNKRSIDIHYEDEVINGERFLKIVIRSYGCSITKEEIIQRKIFELGYRGEYSGERGRQGTGSGLYIADKIVNAHRGKICIESFATESSLGTEQALNIFTVYWPVRFQQE